MAASTREVFLLLRARDEASRVIRGFSGELTRAATQAMAAALRAEAMTKRQEAARLRAAGATRQQVDALMNEARALDDNAKSMEAHNRRMRQFAQGLGQVAGALETVGIGLAIAGGLTLKFVFDSVQAYAEYQRQVALTRTQVDGFSASMQELGDIGLDVARRIPVAFEQIQPALFDIFSSTNANLAQAKILLEGFSKAAVAGQTDIQTAARGTMAIMNAYNIPLEDVNKVLDIQFQLVRKGVGTYEEFANVFGRVVPSATRAGQTFETVAAMLAFMTRNGQSAAMASSAAARALDAFSHPKSVQNLENMGIKVKDIHGNFIPLIDILTQLRAKLMAMPPAERVGALFEIFKGAGGTIQARRFIEQILLRAGELEQFRDLLNSMGNASGAMEGAFGQMADTAAAKMQLLGNRWEALKIAIGEAAAPALLQIVDIIGKIVEWFNKLSPTAKTIITQFLIWGSVLSIVIGVALVFLGIIAGIVAAIAAAGLEILVVVGVLAVLGAAIAGVGVFFATLWKRSEEFRNSLGNLKRAVMDLWNQGIKPAFTMIVNYFEANVMPVVNKVIDTIGKYFAKAINAVADEIHTKLIPAIHDAMKWYQDHKAEVDRAIGILIKFGAALAKTAGFIAAVFVYLIGSSAVQGIINLIKFIVLLVDTWTKTVDFIIAAGAFLKDAWNSITQALADAWNFVVNVIQAGIDYVDGIWQAFWGKFGSIFKNTWELIKAISEFGMAAMEFVIKWALFGIEKAWNFVWTNVRDFFVGVWNALVAFWNMVWDKIKGKVLPVVDAIKSFLASAWSSISSTVSSTWNNVYNTIAGWLNSVWSKVTGVMNDIKGFFSGAGDWLYKSGQKIIQGLIDGINSKLKALKDAISTATQWIKNHLPFSPAKVGPLSGKGNPYYSGQSIANLLAKGMLSMTDEVAMASAKLAQQINPTAEVGTAQPLFNAADLARVGGGAQQQGPSKTVNVYNNIYTPEVDARSLSADLGWYIGGQI